MAKVLIPTPLRQFTGKQDAVTASGATVGEVLSDLTSQFPDLRKQIFTDEGKVRSFVNVYLNDEDIRYLSKDATPTQDGDTISLVPSIAGGSTTIAPPQEATLSKDEILRYSRHLIIPEVGIEGQQKLKAAKVLLVGAGGLGAPLGLYLAAAGVGKIGMVDFDVVDFTNLQRQVIHATQDVGRKKLDSAADKMKAINPHVEIVKHEVALTSENALDILKDYDIVVDGTDNFPTRYLVNDACVLLGKPNVYGSIFRFEGQVSVFWGAHGPCYRCLFPEPPPPGLVPSCAEGGVLGVLPGIIGSLQANEVIKLIAGAGDPLIGRLVLFDALKLKFRELKLRKNPDCPICSEHPTQTGLIDYEQFCGIDPAADAVEAAFEISTPELKSWLDEGREVTILDVRNPQEWEINRLDGAKLIPLPELQDRLGELDPAATIVTYCHHGPRSGRAVNFLRQMGFSRAINLAGGIDSWSLMVDPSVPRY